VFKPYDTISCADSLLEHTETTLVMNNVALDDSCFRNLDIECSTHVNGYGLHARIISSLLAALRFNRTENLVVMKFHHGSRSQLRSFSRTPMSL